MEAPCPIARPVRGLGVKITWASPVTVTRVNHLGLILPFGSHSNLLGIVSRLDDIVHDCVSEDTTKVFKLER